MQPSAPVDLPLRQAAHEVQPPHLRPLLHSDHLSPPELALRTRAQATRATGHALRWPTFQPAQVAQFSPGADSDFAQPPVGDQPSGDLTGSFSLSDGKAVLL